MSNYAKLQTGQLAVTGTAQQLPDSGGANPFAGSVPGGGVEVVLTAFAGNSIPIYYGPSGVTTANGAQLAAGQSSPPMRLNNLDQLWVIATTTGASVSFVVTAL